MPGSNTMGGAGRSRNVASPGFVHVGNTFDESSRPIPNDYFKGRSGRYSRDPPSPNGYSDDDEVYPSNFMTGVCPNGQCGNHSGRKNSGNGNGKNGNNKGKNGKCDKKDTRGKKGKKNKKDKGRDSRKGRKDSESDSDDNDEIDQRIDRRPWTGVYRQDDHGGQYDHDGSDNDVFRDEGPPGIPMGMGGVEEGVGIGEGVYGVRGDLTRPNRPNSREPVAARLPGRDDPPGIRLTGISLAGMNPEIDGDLPLFSDGCEEYDWKEVKTCTRPRPGIVVPGRCGGLVNPYNVFPIQYYADVGGRRRGKKKHRRRYRN